MGLCIVCACVHVWSDNTSCKVCSDYAYSLEGFQDFCIFVCVPVSACVRACVHAYACMYVYVHSLPQRCRLC